MKLPKEFPELKTLLKKMSAPFRKFEPLIDLRPIHPTPDDYTVIDGNIPAVQNRKAVLYLEDAYTYHQKYIDYPKYHILHCRTLQDMKEYGLYGRYFATTRTDGQFLVKLSDDEERILFELKLCKNCLVQIKEQYGTDVFPDDPGKFPLADWFETFDKVEDFNQTDQTDVYFDYLSEDWKKRSLACRKNASWICQVCKVNLESDHHLLQAHHKWGTKYNDLEDLIALCIRCHSQQPGGGHSLLFAYPEYQEFKRKYGNTAQVAPHTDLSDLQSTLNREENSEPTLQHSAIEIILR